MIYEYYALATGVILGEWAAGAMNYLDHIQIYLVILYVMCLRIILLTLFLLRYSFPAASNSGSLWNSMAASDADLWPGPVVMLGR